MRKHQAIHGNRPSADQIIAANKLIDKNPALPYIDSAVEHYSWHTLEIDRGLTQLWKDKKLLLPNLKNSESISIASDYSGEVHSSSYMVYSFIICDMSAYTLFSKQTTTLRKKYGLDLPYKEVGFKSLGYAQVKRALTDWLNYSDMSVPGLLFNVVVDKRIRTFAGAPQELNELKQLMTEHSFSHWKKGPLEKVIRILHIVGYLFGLFSRDKTKLFWLTDNDDIASNSKKKDDLLRMLGHSVEIYSKDKKSENIGFATPFEEDMTADWKMKDVLSLADLSAGAVCDFMNSKLKGTPYNPNTPQILEWVGRQSVFLQKQTFYIFKNEDETANTGFFEFYPEKQKNRSINGIPIYL